MAAGNGKPAKALNTANVRQSTLDSMNALMIIRAFRARGHLIANLDPLGLKKTDYHPELDPVHHGFSEGDYDRPIFLNKVLGKEFATLREILQILKETYCGTIGVEFLHMVDPAQKSWIQERIEGPRNQTEFSVNGKRAILQRLTAAESFEKFLHTKYVGTKRFGLDGSESLIPCIEQIMKRGGQLGIQEIVLGMSHRGRLNVLTNIMGKSVHRRCSRNSMGNPSNPGDVQGSGDVKYHLGTSSDRDFDGNMIHLSLTANPSHLEAVNPCRPRQGPRQTASAQGQGSRPRAAAAAARRRGLCGPGHYGGNADDLGTSRLSRRRRDPYRRQQPDRVHDDAGLRALGALLHGCGEDALRADIPRQRRRPGGCGACRAHRHRVQAAVQEGCRDRHVLLPPARTQRRRRACRFAPADHVPHDQDA